MSAVPISPSGSPIDLGEDAGIDFSGGISSGPSAFLDVPDLLWDFRATTGGDGSPAVSTEYHHFALTAFDLTGVSIILDGSYSFEVCYWQDGATSLVWHDLEVTAPGAARILVGPESGAAFALAPGAYNRVVRVKTAPFVARVVDPVTILPPAP